jgi:RNA polymerase sigma factor (sigma-70 family)
MRKREQRVFGSRASPRTMAPTPSQLAAIRHSVRKTAARFEQRLSPECIEDLVQEVLLRLWKYHEEDKLDSPAYVRRVTENTTIDMLRRRGARKRRACHTEKLDTEISQSLQTPEEIVIAREEAEQILEKDEALRKRVTRMIEWHALRQSEEHEKQRGIRSSDEEEPVLSTHLQGGLSCQRKAPVTRSSGKTSSGSSRKHGD